MKHYLVQLPAPAMTIRLIIVSTKFVLHRWRWRANYTYGGNPNYGWGTTPEDAMQDLVDFYELDALFIDENIKIVLENFDAAHSLDIYTATSKLGVGDKNLTL